MSNMSLKNKKYYKYNKQLLKIYGKKFIKLNKLNKIIKFLKIGNDHAFIPLEVLNFLNYAAWELN